MRSEADARAELIRELVAYQRQREELAQLEYQLATMEDPVEKVQRQLEKAALITLYQADRKYNELGLKESAINDYLRVIEVFGRTRSAETARQRLSGIDNFNKNKDSKKGAVL